MDNCDSDRIHKRIDALEAVLGAKLDRAGEAMARQAEAMARQAGVCEGARSSYANTIASCTATAARDWWPSWRSTRPRSRTSATLPGEPREQTEQASSR